MNLIAQTRRGPIEYGIMGQGPAVLVLNWGHINCNSRPEHDNSLSIRGINFSSPRCKYKL